VINTTSEQPPNRGPRDNLRAIRVVLCDVDGVLLDDHFKRRLERDYGITDARSSRFFRDRFVECQLGHADLREELSVELPTWGWHASVDAFLMYWFSDVTQYDVNRNLLAGLVRTRKSRGFSCYLASMQEPYRWKFLINVVKLGDSFDGAFPSFAIGYSKEDPRYYSTVIKELHVPPWSVLIIDDLVSNRNAAVLAGLHALGPLQAARWLSRSSDDPG
jgi:FMN phosphatase YigB (HAD superfamily)